MVRVYVRKTKRADYGEGRLNSAIADIQQHRLTIAKASERYNIPYITLYKRIKGLRGVKSKTQGRPLAIPWQAECKLAENIKTMAKWGYGLSCAEIKEKVREFVTVNNIPNPFKNNRPGTDWFTKFKKRHNLSLRKPETLEYCRKKSTDPFIINKYFDLLENTLDQLKLRERPECLFNLDETSLCTDPTRAKVVGEKGKASCRITAGSGKENVTVLAGCNAAGDKLPPLVIFRGVNVWTSWIPSEEEEQYKGMTYTASQNGWMTSEIFRKYFTTTFLQHVGDKRPILVIYDGHASHLDNSVIEFARNENIHILKLPAHSSHLLQPLDLAVFRSFKAIWEKKLISWQRHHQGLRLPKKEFSILLGKSWSQVSAEVIKNGFKKGGIFPFYRNVVPEEKYDTQALKRWRERKAQETVVRHVTADSIEHEEREETGQREEERVEGREQNLQERESFEQLLLNITKPKYVAPPRRRQTQPDAELITTIVEEGALSSVQNESDNNMLAADGEKETEYIATNSNEEKTLAADEKAELLSLNKIFLSAFKQTTPELKTTRKRLKVGSELVSAQPPTSIPEKSTQPRENKRKNIKKLQKQPIPDDSSESDVSVSYAESDQSLTLDLSDNETLIEQHKDNVNLNDWVLVTYQSNKRDRHFVGQVKAILKNGSFEVHFVRLRKNNFFWPPVEDSDQIDLKDIVTVLPQPVETRRGALHFPLKFAGYNIV